MREESFVYSIGFDAGDLGTDTALLTASHAIFHSDGGKSAPAAVVGFQFQHSALLKLFHNITGNVNSIHVQKPRYILIMLIGILGRLVPWMIRTVMFWTITDL